MTPEVRHLGNSSFKKVKMTKITLKSWICCFQKKKKGLLLNSVRIYNKIGNLREKDHFRISNYTDIVNEFVKDKNTLLWVLAWHSHFWITDIIQSMHHFCKNEMKICHFFTKLMTSVTDLPVTNINKCICLVFVRHFYFKTNNLQLTDMQR